jgi:hypothetical protein
MNSRPTGHLGEFMHLGCHIMVAAARITEWPVALQSCTCTTVGRRWFPLCSAAGVHTLEAGHSNLTRLPEGLHAITQAQVGHGPW